MGMIRSYKDLRVYQDSYAASIEVITKIIPSLPREEKYDLVDQLRRSAKTIPRLIAVRDKHLKKGKNLYRKGKLKAAINEYQKALAIEPGNKEAIRFIKKAKTKLKQQKKEN